ncbi:MAG: acylphosphatase [Candidatus Caldarchaeum sp.]|nr:acylphosphatase [Candidatus Caldarchaeum sp.]
MDNVFQRVETTVDGVVQGVGFRYYVRRTAKRFGVLGYVQNLDDGSVKITCEGIFHPSKNSPKHCETPNPIQVDTVGL